MQKFIRFLKDWTLAISIVMGMLAYFAFAACPLFDGVRPYAEPIVAIVQPTLLTLLVRGRRLAIVLFGWALLNCWTRVYLGVHYVGDLMCGALWGTLVATGIYFATKRLCPTLAASNRHYARHAGFTPGGYQCATVELLELALLTTYFYILFRALFFG